MTCEALVNLENGQISYNKLPVTIDIIQKVQISFNELPQINLGYIVNTTASFSCNHGYILNGSESSTCETSKNWSQPAPICEQGSQIKNCFAFQTELILIFNSANFNQYLFDILI